jgi:hypothetical protein
MSLWTATKETGNGLLGFLDRLAGSKVGQSALELGEAYLNNQLTKEQYDARMKELEEGKTASQIPSWVWPVGIGSAALLVVALLMRRK